MPERKAPQPSKERPVLPELTGDPSVDALLFVLNRVQNWDYEAEQPLPEIVLDGHPQEDASHSVLLQPPVYRQPLVSSAGLNGAMKRVTAIALTVASIVGAGWIAQTQKNVAPREVIAANSVPELDTQKEIPSGNPLGNKNTVVTQGYGVGSHAPAETWGGIDLSIDADGDGDADPNATNGVPVHATHSGTVDVNANTWPGGNCIFVNDGEYRTTYCHLQGFSVTDGESVQQGEVIGEVGSTGNSSGPHLHYEVWKGGVNQNPLDYGALEATDK